MKNIVFSIATNGYADIYADLIATQREYAARYGFGYMLFDKTPPGGLTAGESSWLKISICLYLLRCGYTVLFVDSDAKVERRAPAFEEMFAGRSEVVAVRDEYSSVGMLNGGVIACRPGAGAERFFGMCLRYADIPTRFLPGYVPEFTSLYEQGHLRWVASRSPVFSLADERWNHTNAIDGDQYIWHARMPGVWNRKPKHKQQGFAALVLKKILRGSRTLRLRYAVRWYEGRGMLEIENG